MLGLDILAGFLALLMAVAVIGSLRSRSYVRALAPGVVLLLAVAWLYVSIGARAQYERDRSEGRLPQLQSETLSLPRSGAAR
jgi:hypothetical protein